MTVSINDISQNPTPDISLSQKIAFLKAQASYGGLKEPVEHIDTHMSDVFLAGDLVYKLKRPIKTGYLDFSTLAAREFNCLEEVRLNSRLAADVYLGVVALTYEAEGALAIGGEGEVVDWLVKMRRLPPERGLDRLIKRQQVTDSDVQRLADQLVSFFAELPAAEILGDAYLAGIDRELTENETILQNPKFSRNLSGFSEILHATRAFARQNSSLFLDRLNEGHIVEGHGDLRPEHIYLTHPLVIVDGLEFNKSLRLLDPYDELAFLGFECEILGAPWIGPLLQERVAAKLNNHVSEPLLGFYQTYRATLRARLALAHLLEPVPRKPEKWMPLAQKGLGYAQRAALKMSPPAGR